MGAFRLGLERNCCVPELRKAGFHRYTPPGAPPVTSSGGFFSPFQLIARFVMGGACPIFSHRVERVDHEFVVATAFDDCLQLYRRGMLMPHIRTSSSKREASKPPQSSINRMDRRDGCSGPVVSRNSITTECADFQAVGREGGSCRGGDNRHLKELSIRLPFVRDPRK